MGFVSPAQDYIEDRISLDKQFIAHPSATYFMQAGNTYWRAGITQGALLIVDRSLTPCDDSVVVCCIAGAGFGCGRIGILRAWRATGAGIKSIPKPPTRMTGF